MNLEKSLTNIEKDITNLISKAEEPMKNILEFVKSHKKLLITLVAIYIGYKYLFSEEE